MNVLSRRFSLFPIVGTFFIMLCVTGAAFYQIYKQRMDEERIVGVQLADLASQAMSLWLNDQIAIARTMAQTPAISEACTNPSDVKARHEAADLLRAFHGHHPSYALMGIISYMIPPEGVVVNNSTGKEIRVYKGQSLGDSRDGVSVGVGGMDFNYIAAVYKGARGFISEAKANAVPGLPPVFVLATPVFGPDGMLTGCLYASISLQHFSRNFSQNSHLPGNSTMEIVDERGRFVGHESPARVLSTEKPPQAAMLSQVYQGIRHFSVLDENKHTNLYSAAEVIPNYHAADRWWMLFRRDMHEVLSELHAPLLSLGLLFVLLFLLVAYLMRKMGLHLRQIVVDQTLRAELDLQLQLKQVMQKERATLRRVLDNIQGVVFLRDAEGRYVVINSHYTAILGLTQEQVEGKTDDDLLPPELALFCRKTDECAMAASGPYYFEQIMPLADGSPHDYFFSKEALFNEEGTFDGILAVAIDVTLLKTTQHELAEAKIKAEDANRAKSAFLSTVSHEIRTPMNAIVGFAHLLGNSVLDDKQKDYLQKIHTASANLLDIINNVLDLSKIESGKLDLECVPFRLDELLLTVASTAEIDADAKGIDFVLEVAPHTPNYLLGDPTRVQQLLLNLVNNAIKFTSKGSVSLHVALEAEDAAKGRMSIARHRASEALGNQSMTMDTAQGNTLAPSQTQAANPALSLASPSSHTSPLPPSTPVSLCFTIIDSGVGMTAQQQLHIFETFTQADTSITRKYGGTGLGLSICHELVECMGGNITVYSEEGHGSTFYVTITLHEVAANTVPPPATTILSASLRSNMAQKSNKTPSPSSENKVSENKASQTKASESQSTKYNSQSLADFDILLVEDNDINQEIACALLEALGLRVDTASDGQQALDMVRNRRYDLIFMDMQMPIMDGLESTRRMRAIGRQSDDGHEHSWLRTVPIVALTANALQEDKNACLAAGMNDHHSKPLNPDILHAVLLRWLLRD